MARSTVAMSEVFDSYEEDFCRLRGVVREKLAVASGGGDPQVRESALRKADGAHEEAGQALQQLELEAKSMGKLGTSVNPKLRDYRNDLASTRRQLRETQTALKRQGLLRESSSSSSTDARDTASRLVASSRRLEEARGMALDAESVGISVLGELHAQRDTISRTKGYVHETHDNLGVSKSLLQTMGNRNATQQAMIVGIAGMLVLTTVVVFCSKVHSLYSSLLG
uniref:Vesicle transport v-SNARE N-terminal domain-containing protein n=1 Tax=Noctiluca scintillans TaxID=2966 RepID=A0A7S1F2D9_NOCSC